MSVLHFPNHLEEASLMQNTQSDLLLIQAIGTIGFLFSTARRNLKPIVRLHVTLHAGVVYIVIPSQGLYS